MFDPTVPDPDLAPHQVKEHETVVRLMKLIDSQEGFSSLSAHISDVFRLTSEESNATTSQLVNILGKDITLSQRVLSLANSAAVGAGSRDLPGAVLLLGLDRVRTCVTTALMEKQFGLGTPVLRTAMLSSFHSSMLAKTIARDCGVRSPADAFTAAMFHNLGRMLSIHYMPEAFAEIQERASDNRTEERTEASGVIGIDFHLLGRAVGRHWHLAESILDCMRPLPISALGSLDSADARLQACAGFANEVTHVLLHDPDGKDLRMYNLLSRVNTEMDVDLGVLNPALIELADPSLKYSHLIRLDERDSPGIAGIVNFERLAEPVLE